MQDLNNIEPEQSVDDILAGVLDQPMTAEQQLAQVERVLEALRRVGQLGRGDAAELDILVSVGKTYLKFSHLGRALETFESAMEIAESLADTSKRALLLRSIGLVYKASRRWDDALDYLQRSELMYRELDDDAGLASVILNRGSVNAERSRYPEAEAAYNEALELARSSGNARTAVSALNNLAIVQTIQGKLDDAISQYQECVVLYEGLDESAGVARSYANMGMTYADKREWATAMSCYEKAFHLAEEDGALELIANIHLSRAELLLELGDSALAAPACAKALDIYRQTNDRLGEADAFRLLGMVFTRREQWTNAEKLFEQSIEINRQFEHKLGEAEAFRDRGRMFVTLETPRQARTDFEQALEIFREVGALADVERVQALIDSLPG